MKKKEGESIRKGEWIMYLIGREIASDLLMEKNMIHPEIVES